MPRQRQIFQGLRDFLRALKLNRDLAAALKPQEAGESFEKALSKEKKAKDAAKKSTKDLSDSNKELKKSYAEMGKSLAEGTKSVGSIVIEEQKAINKTQGALTDLFSGDYDFYKDFSKQTELEKLLDRQEQAKKRSEDILERQTASQLKLAEALEYYSKTEKVFRFEAPNDPNPLEALISLVIDMLYGRAREEGTAIQA